MQGILNLPDLTHDDRVEPIDGHVPPLLVHAGSDYHPGLALGIHIRQWGMRSDRTADLSI